MKINVGGKVLWIYLNRVYNSCIFTIDMIA